MEWLDKKYIPRNFVTSGALPFLSAKCCAVYDSGTNELLCGKQECIRREIASLTKIMTAYTALTLVSRFNVNILASKIEVSLDAALLEGTSADLAEGDVLSVWDMLHAMLLPSGNDAAYAIAEYFGMLLSELGLPAVSKYSDPVHVFVAEMNKNARLLGMKDTTYANPHGLQNYLNKSTALDIAKLSSVCMEMPLFADIVKRQSYTCTGNDIDGDQHVFTWYNTNRMLSKGFNGLKTGVTPSAGPCLVSTFKHDGRNIVIVLLACRSGEHRWHESARLKEYALQMLETRSTTTAESTPGPKQHAKKLLPIPAVRSAKAKSPVKAK